MTATKSCYLLFCRSQFLGSQTGSWQAMLHPSSWSHMMDHQWPHTQHMPHSRCLHGHRMSVLLALIHRAAEFHRLVWCQISAASTQYKLHLYRWSGRVQWMCVNHQVFGEALCHTHTYIQCLFDQPTYHKTLQAWPGPPGGTSWIAAML